MLVQTNSEMMNTANLKRLILSSLFFIEVCHLCTLNLTVAVFALLSPVPAYLSHSCRELGVSDLPIFELLQLLKHAIDCLFIHQFVVMLFIDDLVVEQSPYQHSVLLQVALSHVRLKEANTLVHSLAAEL
jgi:hypothetical protein